MTDAPKYQVIQWLYYELSMSRRQIADYLRTSRSLVHDALSKRMRNAPNAWRRAA